jgi:1-acyl-sn-glycerol-3-phosphate acyltransferase
VEVQGLEYIPAQGAGILAANHLGRLDSVLVFSLLERPDATALVADTYKRNPLLRWLINQVGGIWINREQADLGALRAAREHLRKGGLLGIAPEGTRSRTGALTKAKTGAAYLVDKTGVPVIPIAITGTENAFREWMRLRRPRLNVRVGQPFCLPTVQRAEREAVLQRNTEEIMCRIAALLPAKYRGVYSDHPRLNELLGGSDQPLHFSSTDKSSDIGKHEPGEDQ